MPTIPPTRGQPFFPHRQGDGVVRDAYLPEVERRSERFASPLRASGEQLAGLAPALVIVDEADMLRDEGEAYS